jgi:hypothetical protein
MRTHDLATPEPTPSCEIITLPLSTRIGRIREVALKLHGKSTERAADYYRRQVLDGLFSQLQRLDVPAQQQEEMVGSFWEAVNVELARLNHLNQKPGDR